MLMYCAPAVQHIAVQDAEDVAWRHIEALVTNTTGRQRYQALDVALRMLAQQVVPLTMMQIGEIGIVLHCWGKYMNKMTVWFICTW